LVAPIYEELKKEALQGGQKVAEVWATILIPRIVNLAHHASLPQDLPGPSSLDPPRGLLNIPIKVLNLELLSNDPPTHPRVP
jgi:hypothetical protein